MPQPRTWKPPKIEYLAVIKAKTAALFSAAAGSGADHCRRATLRPRGPARLRPQSGPCFQLVDDALDYGGSAADLGKNTGDDFREGKITLPVILSYRRGTDEERAFWKGAIEGGASDDASLQKAIGADDETRRDCRHGAARPPFRRDRTRCAGPAQGVAAKDALIEVVDFCISRVN